jgi:hypothetical protein
VPSKGDPVVGIYQMTNIMQQRRRNEGWRRAGIVRLPGTLKSMCKLGYVIAAVVAIAAAPERLKEGCDCPGFVS